MATNLSGIKTDEISLVDAPAVGRPIAVIKSVDGEAAEAPTPVPESPTVAASAALTAESLQAVVQQAIQQGVTTATAEIVSKTAALVEKSTAALAAQAAELAEVKKAFDVHTALVAEKVDAAKMIVENMAAVEVATNCDAWWDAYNTLDQIMAGIRSTAAVLGATLPASAMPEVVEKSAVTGLAPAAKAIQAFVTKAVFQLAEVTKAAEAAKAKLAEPAGSKSAATVAPVEKAAESTFKGVSALSFTK